MSLPHNVVVELYRRQQADAGVGVQGSTNSLGYRQPTDQQYASNTNPQFPINAPFQSQAIAPSLTPQQLYLQQQITNQQATQAYQQQTYQQQVALQQAQQAYQQQSSTILNLQAQQNPSQQVSPYLYAQQAVSQQQTPLQYQQEYAPAEYYQQPQTALEEITSEPHTSIFSSIKHFLLVALVTSTIVGSFFYGPLLVNEAQYWWKQNYQPQDERDVKNTQKGVFNAIYPDQLPQHLASADYTGSPDVPIVPKDNRVVISKAEVNAPIIPITDFSEAGVLKVIEQGIGYYTNTAEPGTVGNAVITGHSSYYLWSPGEYKFVFSHLEDLPIGGKITLYWDGKKLDYTIYEMKKVKPVADEAQWVFAQDPTSNESTLTAITCWPTGTAQQRLIVRAKLDNFVPPVSTPKKETASSEPSSNSAPSSLPYIL